MFKLAERPYCRDCKARYLKMNLANKLEQEAKIYSKKEENHEHDYYHRNALPEIVAYNKQYRKENPEKYPLVYH